MIFFLGICAFLCLGIACVAAAVAAEDGNSGGLIGALIFGSSALGIAYYAGTL